MYGYGLAHREVRRPVDSDTIWSLASVTKPFTATAVMLLVERGIFSLDEPLYRLLPEFLDAPAFFGAGRHQQEPQSPRAPAHHATPEPAPEAIRFDRRAVTLRHVLAHCSGLPGFSEDNTQLRMQHRPLEDFVRSFGRQPLLFAPGTAHYYSNPGILMAAEAVGRALAGALGQRADTPEVGRFLSFVGEHILAPLGMVSSALRPPAAWNERIAWVERTGQEGKDWEGANSAYYRSLGIPWGGMFSTPRELVRFVDLFLPVAAGRRRVGFDPSASSEAVAHIVSPATARAMTTVQFAPPDASADLVPDLRDAAAGVSARPAVEWGIGWEIKGTKRPHRTGELTSPAAHSHNGATGTMVWADPATDVACVLLTNRTLVSGWTTERPRQALFSNAVMAAAK